MTRLTFEALNEKAEQVANEELLSKVSGGKKEDCHDDSNTNDEPISDPLSTRPLFSIF